MSLRLTCAHVSGGRSGRGHSSWILRDALHTGTACLRCGVGTVTLDAQKPVHNRPGFTEMSFRCSVPDIAKQRRTTDLSKIAPPLGGDGLHQRGDLDRREIGEVSETA